MENREAKRYGMRLGAYDGARKRRFVLFTTHDAPAGSELRREFDTKRERDAKARELQPAANAVFGHKPARGRG